MEKRKPLGWPIMKIAICTAPHPLSLSMSLFQPKDADSVANSNIFLFFELWVKIHRNLMCQLSTHPPSSPRLPSADPGRRPPTPWAAWACWPSPHWAPHPPSRRSSCRTGGCPTGAMSGPPLASLRTGSASGDLCFFLSMFGRMEIFFISMLAEKKCFFFYVVRKKNIFFYIDRKKMFFFFCGGKKINVFFSLLSEKKCFFLSRLISLKFTRHTRSTIFFHK